MRRRVFLIFILVCSVNMPGLALSQNPSVESPTKVKAAFLRNFAHYVNWPGNVFPDARSPWRIGILGPDPFGNVLERTFEGRMEQGRSFEVFRADRLDELPQCQIIVVTYEDDLKRRAVLSDLMVKPILTVGDAPNFLQEGGIIRFQVEDRVKMSINLDQARAASLSIKTKMLEVAHGILENGILSRAR